MPKIFFITHKKNNSGFTLVEALVAVSVFTVSILSLLTVLSDGISDTNYAKKKMIAVYLAQEGIEFTRNLRDTYMLYDASGWTSFENKLNSSGCMNPTNGCYYNDGALAWIGDQTMPMIDISYIACTSQTCNNGALLYNVSTGKYGFSGNNSGFTRQIKATIRSSSEITISSTVYWTQGSGTYRLTLSENLFNWAE